MKYFHLLLFLVPAWLFAQEPKATPGPFLLRGATVETVTQGRILADILIRDGVIAEVRSNIATPEGVTVIDCQGKTIYPGLIDAGTQIGLFEIGSIDLTQDFTEVGDVTPQMRALTAVNPHSAHIAINRMGGVTTVLTMPGSGVYSGQAALIHLYGYTPEAMFAGFEGLMMRFPSTARRGRRDNRSEEDIEKDRKKALERVDEVWKMAVEYHRLDSLHIAGLAPAPAYHPEMRAMLPAVRRQAKVLIEVNRAEDILSAIEWVKAHNVDAVFMGVAEGWRVAAKIAEAGIPVITGPVLSLPTRDSDRYDMPYKNAGIMHQAGVKVAIRTFDTQSANSRNLPFHAGFAAAYGMGKEAALQAVTIAPATILGVDDQLGSVEQGKVANLVVTDGDIFEPKTQIFHVFIEGWQMPNSSRQHRLYDEFLERNP